MEIEADSKENPYCLDPKDAASGTHKSFIDLNYEYETGSGRVIVDPAEAKNELGALVASKLKLDKTGQVVLWPQPSDDPEDPQNWDDFRKFKILVVMTMAAFVTDFSNSVGIACLFPLAKEYNTTPGQINNVSSKFVLNINSVASSKPKDC